MSELIIFYDSTCPLCAKEMRALQAYDTTNKLRLLDLHSEEYASHYGHVNFDEAMRILHAQQNGKVLKGLDVTAAAWRAVGKKQWVQLLRWPIIRWFADRAYVLFADNRYRLSWMLTGQARCNNGVCESKKS